MITKIPKWLLAGGAILALSAGCVNVVALMGFTKLSVSHVTGNVSMFSVAVAQADFKTLAFICASLLAFLFGAIVSGFIIGQKSLKLGRRYGRALFLEAGLLLLSSFLFNHHDYFGQLAAAMACGLQNAMIATYSGAVIRTTHLTGLTSDMGAAIGNWLAGREISKLTLGFQAIIWYSFCGGGVIGALLYLNIGYMALLLPAFIVLIAAVCYNWLSAK